jgi:hypothetical protein
MHHPTAADYRHQVLRRERWYSYLAGLAVMAVAALVFWLLPFPAKAQGRCFACDAASHSWWQRGDASSTAANN